MTIVVRSDIYDVIADGYDRAHSRWLRFAGGEAQCAFEGAVTALMKPGMAMLDAACGTGTVARRLLREADDVVRLVLLDSSVKMLARCADISAEKVTGCVMNLPFDTDRFDLVTCAWGVETVDDPALALAEFVRVTRPGGHVCLVFCADRPARSILGAAVRRHVATSGRGRFLDHTTMRKQAQQAGARSVRGLHCSGPAAAMILQV